MIRMPGQNAGCAIKLFKQHDANELVRPSRGAECEFQFGALAQARCQSVRAADDKTGSRAIFGPPFLQQRGERRTAEFSPRSSRMTTIDCSGMTVAMAIDSSTRRRSASCAPALREFRTISQIRADRAAGRSPAHACDRVSASSRSGPCLRRPTAAMIRRIVVAIRRNSARRNGSNRAARHSSLRVSAFSLRAAPAGPSPTFFRDHRRHALRAGRRARLRRRRRSGPSRNAGRLQPGSRTPTLWRSSTIRSATEPTWRCERPDETRPVVADRGFVPQV